MLVRTKIFSFLLLDKMREVSRTFAQFRYQATNYKHAVAISATNWFVWMTPDIQPYEQNEMCGEKKWTNSNKSWNFARATYNLLHFLMPCRHSSILYLFFVTRIRYILHIVWHRSSLLLLCVCCVYVKIRMISWKHKVKFE